MFSFFQVDFYVVLLDGHTDMSEFYFRIPTPWFLPLLQLHQNQYFKGKILLVDNLNLSPKKDTVSH